MATNETVLISPLGRSPGAVSSVYFALKAIGHSVSRVVTVGTSDVDVLTSTQDLTNLFELVGVSYEPRNIRAAELRGVDDSTHEFISRIGQAMEVARRERSLVHVAVTGGRSSMGALASLAASLYGADRLWHIWVRDDIARGSEIDKLPRPIRQDSIYLNPPLGASELVSLPFMDLRPFHPYIRDFYLTQQIPSAGFPLAHLLQDENLVSLPNIYPADVPLRQEARIAEMNATYGKMNQSEQVNMVQELGTVLHQTRLLDETTVTRITRNIQNPPENLLTLLAEGDDPSGFVAWLQTNWASVQTAVTNRGRWVSITKLRQMMGEVFNDSELRTLCQDLNMDYDDIPGAAKTDKIRELIAVMKRQGRVPQLVVFCERLRSGRNWWEDGKTAVSPDESVVVMSETDLFLLQALDFWLKWRSYS